VAPARIDREICEPQSDPLGLLSPVERECLVQGDRVGRCDTRFDQLERRFETRFDVSDRRFEALDDKVARHFTWLVGIQVTTLAAIVGALLARA
jgi:hypothetical protein